MKDPLRPTPLMICTSCGSQQPPGAHLCAKCNAPLTPFAHSDWVLGIQSRGFALQKATNEPRNLIVVVGMWLWLGPILILGLVLGSAGMMGMVESIRSGDSSILRPTMVTGLIGAGMTWVAGAILYRTTFGYLRDRHRLEYETEERAADEGVEPELLQCLSCGETFAAETDPCPKCGWSFTDGAS
jgi:hypothetical protein